MPQKAVSFFVNKTLNTVLKNSQKLIFRVCEAANVKKKFKMFQMYSSMQRRNLADDKDIKEPETTGHDRFYQERSRYKVSFSFSIKPYYLSNTELKFDAFLFKYVLSLSLSPFHSIEFFDLNEGLCRYFSLTFSGFFF